MRLTPCLNRGRELSQEGRSCGSAAAKEHPQGNRNCSAQGRDSCALRADCCCGAAAVATPIFTGQLRSFQRTFTRRLPVLLERIAGMRFLPASATASRSFRRRLSEDSSLN
jgi:hypothetical protein